MSDQDWRKHIWRPGERAEALDRLAVRTEQNADATDLAPRRQPPAEPAIVTKAAPARAAAAATPGNEWVRWARREIKHEANRSSRAMTKAVAKVLIDEEKARDAADGEMPATLEAWKAEFAALRGRLDAIEATKASVPARALPNPLSLVG
jgi:hypothetical protein